MPAQQDVILIHRKKPRALLQPFDARTGFRDQHAVICDGLQAAVLAGADLILAQGVQFGEKRLEDCIASVLRRLWAAPGHFDMDQAGLINQTHARGRQV